MNETKREFTAPDAAELDDIKGKLNRLMERIDAQAEEFGNVAACAEMQKFEVAAPCNEWYADYEQEAANAERKLLAAMEMLSAAFDRIETACEACAKLDGFIEGGN